MVELPYATVDADNHYYEPVDCFTRHIEADKAHLAFHLEVLDGVEQPVIDGRSAATFIYGGFMRDHIARPGSMREMLRNVKKGAMTDVTNPVVGPAERAWFERDARLELMDRQHVASTLLFPSTGVCVEPTFQGDKATLYANYKAFNRWLAEDWGLGADGRLYGAPLISLLDVDEAVAELDWALERGCKVINLTAGPAYGRSPADPHFDPFWARMDEARVICAVHVGDAGYNRRNAAAWGEDVVPTAFEQSAFQWTHFFGDRPIMETISALIYGNLFGRFPNVRVASVENGSLFVDYLLKLMDKMVGMAPGRPVARRPLVGQAQRDLPPARLRVALPRGGHRWPGRPDRRRPGAVRLRLPPPRGPGRAERLRRGALRDVGGRHRAHHAGQPGRPPRPLTTRSERSSVGPVGEPGGLASCRGRRPTRSLPSSRSSSTSATYGLVVDLDVGPAHGDQPTPRSLVDDVRLPDVSLRHRVRSIVIS